MSIHYGVSKYTYETVKKRSLNYQLFFTRLLLNTDSVPVSLDGGFPFARIYCKGHHPDAGFKILTHRFDTDDVIKSPLKIILKIRICEDDGNVQVVDLDKIDYYGADIGRSETTYFLEREYKFKDIKKVGHRGIWAFDIIFQQTTFGHYGNESVMDIVVDY